MFWWRKYKENLLHYLPFVILILIAVALRILNLGYSDFQGDEIKALFLPETNQSISDFLLTQRKGPVQFLITYLLKFLDPMYTNQILIRLPFALAGILSVFFFYKLISQEFNNKVAFYSAFFLATNGFFVAFSRIVQYQSFVILFMILALYCFSLASKADRWAIRGIYLGFLFWALSILSHYDGIFIFPFVGYLLFRWSKKQVFNFKNLFQGFAFFKNIKHIAFAAVIFFILVCVFYIPFIFNIDEATQNYWQGRLEGTGGKISSSRYLFTAYQPIYVVHVYTILFVFGLIELIKVFIGFDLLYVLFKSKLRTIGALFLLIFSDRFLKIVSLNLWFLVPLVFMEVFVNIPGTHIYTYLLPMFIFMAFGINFIERIIFLVFRHLGYVLTSIGVFVIFTFIFLQSYAVFVDHAVEYPWTSEKFFVWEFPQPSPIFHLSMFGFPYYRHWEEVSEFIVNEDALIACPRNREIEECPFKLNKIRYYSTNERESMSRYHIPFSKDAGRAGYFVHVRNPQSFTDDILNEKASYWAENYVPIKTFQNCPEDISTGNFSDILGLHKGYCKGEQKDVTLIYYMVSGELDVLQQAGF